MTDLAGKKVFITGAASGIGRATALAAAREGAILYLTDIAAAGLEQTAKEIEREGGRVAMQRAFDIADFEAVQAFARAIHAAQGSVDVVMNIAGISVWGAIDKLEHQHWRRCVDVNLMGPIHVLECFVPRMIEARRGGHIVNVSSAAGLFGLPWHAAYSASKFGLRGVSEVLRFDLARHGIHVSLVCPGGVDTGLIRTVEIVGLDAQNPEMSALRRRFQKHAISPERAARAILSGVRHNRYWVFTSPDVRVGYWSQRLFAPPYELVMRLINNRLHAVASRQRKQAAASTS